MPRACGSGASAQPAPAAWNGSGPLRRSPASDPPEDACSDLRDGPGMADTVVEYGEFEWLYKRYWGTQAVSWELGILDALVLSHLSQYVKLIYECYCTRAFV